MNKAEPEFQTNFNIDVEQDKEELKGFLVLLYRYAKRRRALDAEDRRHLIESPLWNMYRDDKRLLDRLMIILTKNKVSTDFMSDVFQGLGFSKSNMNDVSEEQYPVYTILYDKLYGFYKMKHQYKYISSIMAVISLFIYNSLILKTLMILTLCMNVLYLFYIFPKYKDKFANQPKIRWLIVSLCLIPFQMTLIARLDNNLEFVNSLLFFMMIIIILLYFFHRSDYKSKGFICLYSLVIIGYCLIPMREVSLLLMNIAFELLITTHLVVSVLYNKYVLKEEDKKETQKVMSNVAVLLCFEVGIVTCLLKNIHSNLVISIVFLLVFLCWFKFYNRS